MTRPRIRVQVAALVTLCAKLSAACAVVERYEALDAAAAEELNEEGAEAAAA